MSLRQQQQQQQLLQQQAMMEEYVMQEVSTAATTGAATGAASGVMSYAVDNLTPEELINPDTADAVAIMASDAALGAGIGAAVGLMSPEDVYAAITVGGERQLEGGKRGELMEREVEYAAYFQVPEEEEEGEVGGRRMGEGDFEGRRRAAGVRRGAAPTTIVPITPISTSLSKAAAHSLAKGAEMAGAAAGATYKAGETAAHTGMSLATSATDKLRQYAQVGLSKTAQTAGAAVGVGHSAVEAFPWPVDTQAIDRTATVAGTAVGTAVGLGTTTINYAKRAAGTAIGFALLPVNFGINMSYNIIDKGAHMALNVTEAGLNAAGKVTRGAAERVAWVVGAVVGTTERLGTEVFNSEAFQKGYTGRYRLLPTTASGVGQRIDQLGGTVAGTAVGAAKATTGAVSPPSEEEGKVVGMGEGYRFNIAGGRQVGTVPEVPQKGVRVVKATKISPELTAARAAYEKGKASDAIGAVAGKTRKPYGGEQYAGGANRAI